MLKDIVGVSEIHVFVGLVLARLSHSFTLVTPHLSNKEKTH
jgi:hypothetical protein